MATQRRSSTRRGGPLRGGVVGLVVSALLFAGSTAVDRPAAASDLPEAGATATAPSLVVEGRGWGHGDGLSQVGAYGYAVRFGWDWQRILAHYYGGTTLGGLRNDWGDLMSVRLKAFDDDGVVAVARGGGGLRTSANPGAPGMRSIVAVETGPATYRVFGRSDTASCPTGPLSTTLLTPANGWSELTTPSGIVSGTATGLPATRLDVWVDGVDTVTAPAADLIVACEPGDEGAERAYRGSIRIVNGTEGENRVVNRVPLESMVRGVVPRESPAGWADAGGGSGINALRAQAVAARTYAAAESRYSYARSCDDQDCQVYGGAARRTDLGGGAFGFTPLEDARSDRAVADTAGVVLRRGPGADAGYAYAQFSASSGGWTSGANFPAVQDEGDPFGPWSGYNTWTASVPIAEIEADWPTIGKYQSVEVLRRNGLGEWGGRVQQMVLRGTAGTVTITGEQFRSRLGLKSSWFRVGGCSGASAAAGTPTAPSGYRSLPVPVRILDTREGLGTPAGPVPAYCEVGLQVTGRAGVPSTGVTAVLLNVTAVAPAGDGFVTAYPCASGRPWTSNLNPPKGGIVAGSVVVAPDEAGRVCLYTMAASDLVVDVQGWFDAAQQPFVPDGPRRLVDTRNGPGPTGIAGVLEVAVGAGGPVVLNVTATESRLPGFVTAYACDKGRPLASNLNLVPGRDVPNQVVSAVSADGRVCLYTSAPTHLVVDLLGRYGDGGSRLRAVPASRLLDTREGSGVPVRSMTSTRLQVAGRAGVPSTGANAAVVVVTATDATLPGFLTAYPCDRPVPVASNVNYVARLASGNLATVPLAADGSLCVFSQRDSHVVVDVFGWFG